MTKKKYQVIDFLKSHLISTWNEEGNATAVVLCFIIAVTIFTAALSDKIYHLNFILSAKKTKLALEMDLSHEIDQLLIDMNEGQVVKYQDIRKKNYARYSLGTIFQIIDGIDIYEISSKINVNLFDPNDYIRFNLSNLLKNKKLIYLTNNKSKFQMNIEYFKGYIDLPNNGIYFTRYSIVNKNTISNNLLSMLITNRAALQDSFIITGNWNVNLLDGLILSKLLLYTGFKIKKPSEKYRQLLRLQGTIWNLDDLRNIVYQTSDEKKRYNNELKNTREDIFSYLGVDSNTWKGSLIISDEYMDQMKFNKIDLYIKKINSISPYTLFKIEYH